MPVYKTVYVNMCACVCIFICLGSFLSFSIELKNYTKNKTEVVVAEGRPNQLQLLARLHQAQSLILAGIFEMSGQHSRVGLKLMIYIFKL